MGDLCISLNDVKPRFLPAAKGLNRDEDGKICQSNNPEIDAEDFADFVETIRIKPEIKEVLVIEIIPMIVVSDKLRIMEGPVTVGLFKNVMQGTGYSHKLQPILDDFWNIPEVLRHVNFCDAREFATRLSELSGREFRLPTEAEWEQARQASYRLTGDHLIWTQPQNEETFVGKAGFDCGMFMSDDTCPACAIQLVEDL